MQITSKSRYALKIMMELAQAGENQLSKRAFIATKHKIPLDFMDQITLRLRKKHLLTSVRGPLGGLRLSLPADQITVWDIFFAVEDHIYPVRCLHEHSCDQEHDCIAYDAWHTIFFAIQNELKTRNLSSLSTISL